MILICGSLLLAGCSARHYRRSADREATAAIAEKSPAVPNMPPDFTLETNPPVSLAGLPLRTNAPPYLGEYGERERNAVVLSLEQSLEIAVTHSRLYRNNKEQLYLAALSLTLARHQFAPLFSASSEANYAVDTVEALAFEPDPAHPGEVRPILSDNLVEQHRVTASGQVGASWLLRDVGRISTAFTTDFLRFVTGDPRLMTSSQLGATFVRPLLRDAGFKADQENLTQAERDLLYAIRDFVRFRKGFSVQIASAYYGVLGDRDAVRNSFLNLQSSRRAAERTRALAREGRATQADLGRLEQQELSAESAWINAIRTYLRSLDDFKIQLGLPVEAKLVLDDGELQSLRILDPKIPVDDALKIALTARLDYQNLVDAKEDVERRVKLAADRLKPQVDLVAGASISSPEDRNGFALPDPQRYRWNAGLNLDLGLDRKAERNSYRAALIAAERATREVVQRRDEIELEVRESWRALEQARRNFEISELSVELARRRVEEQNLLAELGRARAQDQVDAQNDLVSSLDARTRALVGHTIARLQFWHNMGILYIKDKGKWEDFDEGSDR